MLAVDVTSDREHAEGVATVENARRFVVHTVVYEEEAEGGCDRAIVGFIEIDSLGEDQKLFVNAQSQFVGKIEEAKRLALSGFLAVFHWIVLRLRRCSSPLIHQPHFAHAIDHVVNRLRFTRHPIEQHPPKRSLLSLWLYLCIHRVTRAYTYRYRSRREET
ncbi:hypothetical protein CUC08_Gglean001155 [Alternaria sp. MG1]|jgi:hypothetical protein|nr:hypothetical protein CUC08_Gglean001155 [Alternaria sp. MG1]